MMSSSVALDFELHFYFVFHVFINVGNIYLFCLQFFEHGTVAQIRELANHLIGNVLTLSLQMYGCRVIQKVLCLF